MHDMLRIMDVASALRRERETAVSQLDADAAKARLRERLLATAHAAGEPVTPAEVDAAIERYFAQQHVYADPPPSLRRLAAHLWVARVPVLVLLGLAALATAAGVAAARAFADPEVPRSTPGLAPAPEPQPAPTPAPAPAPDPAAAAAELARAWQAFERTVAATTKAAADDAARERVRGIASAGEIAHAGGRLEALLAAQRDLEALAARLAETYAVRIVSRPGEDSGVERRHSGRTSGLYLVVEAVDDRGRVLARPIRDAEGGATRTVRKWGEQVSERVWDRIVADKTADGVVDEAEFARKVRGRLDETIVLDDGTGRPLRRGRQITQW